ncbi:MAG: DUF882 domain-containing protein [Caldimonas sp.]
MNNPSRRRFVTALGASAFILGPGRARADAGATRVLSLDNLHTGEKLVAEYFERGRYVADAVDAVNHLLRDFRTGDVGTIDTALLDLLHRLAAVTDSKRAFQVISGYRSPRTNEALRQRSSGVAGGSLHMRGQAIDIRVADVPLATLRDAALALHSGGVGYYATSNFVHVDTGRVRAW